MQAAARANCFDASALIKRYVDEPGSEILRSYWNGEPTKFTTSICFYETLTLLKVFHFYRKALDEAQYRKSELDLCAWYSTVVESIPEPKFLTPEVFFSAQAIAKKHQIDLSDAFQIISVKDGFFSGLAGESRTILVSADEKLVNVARNEGLRAWNLLQEPAP